MARRPNPLESVDPAGEFPLEPPLYFLHLALVVTRRREARLEQALRACGLSPAGFRALRVVNRFGSATMGELADYTLTDRTTLTRVIDDLVHGGLMTRFTPAGDRRKVALELTAPGRRSFDEAVLAVAEALRELMRDLPDAELRTAIRVSQEIVGRLSESEQQLDRLLWRTNASRPSRRRRSGAAAS